MQNYSIVGNHVIGSKLEMDWGASYSKAEEQRPEERYISYEAETADNGESIKLGSNFLTKKPMFTFQNQVGPNQYALDELT